MDVSSATSMAAMEITLNKAAVEQEILNKTLERQEDEENKYAAKMSKPAQSVTGDARGEASKVDIRV